MITPITELAINPTTTTSTSESWATLCGCASGVLGANQIRNSGPSNRKPSALAPNQSNQNDQYSCMLELASSRTSPPGRAQTAGTTSTATSRNRSTLLRSANGLA